MALNDIAVGDSDAIVRSKFSAVKGEVVALRSDLAAETRARQSAFVAERQIRQAADQSETLARRADIQATEGRLQADDLADPIRPGEGRGFTLEAGAPAGADPLPAQMQVDSDFGDGRVAQISGHGQLGPLRRWRVEPGRDYSVRFAFRIVADAAAPGSDAIRLALWWYDGEGRLISVTVLKDITDITTASGRQDKPYRYSAYGGDDDDTVAPAGTVEVWPCISTHGGGITHVEVIERVDLATASGYVPDESGALAAVAGLTARTEIVEDRLAGAAATLNNMDDAERLTKGVLHDDRLSPNVMRRDTNQTVTGTKSFANELRIGDPAAGDKKQLVIKKVGNRWDIIPPKVSGEGQQEGNSISIDIAGEDRWTVEEDLRIGRDLDVGRTLRIGGVAQPPSYINSDAYALGSDSHDGLAIMRAIDKAYVQGLALFTPKRTYAIGEKILLPNGLVWYGNKARLRLKNGVNTRVIEAIAAASNTITGELHDLSIDGNKDNQSGTSEGIYVQGGYRYNMHNVLVERARGDGIEYALGDALHSFENYIYSSQVYRCGGWCVRGTGAVTDTHILGGDFGASAGGGISMATSWSIKSATVWGGGVAPGATGIQTGGPNNKIVDTQVEGWGGHGIVNKANNSFTQIKGCPIYACSWGADGTYDGIYDEGGTSKGCNYSDNEIYAAVAGSNGIMRRAITLGTHTAYTILGNDLRFARALAAVDLSADLVTGLHSSDITDYSWVHTRVFATMATNQTDLDASYRTVNFDTDSAADIDGEFDTAAHTLTFKQSCRARITVALMLTPTSASASAVIVRTTKNGAEQRRLDHRITTSTSAQMVGGMTVEFFAAGDTLKIEAWCANGGVIVAGSVFTYLQVEKVS